MARCGCTGSGICECTIQAGTGTTVTGTGSTPDPYIVSASPAVGEIEGLDTASVDMTVTGDGTVGTPWEISATVIPEAIRDIIGTALGSAQGLVYNDAGDTISALISGDANNSLTFGTDDGLYIPNLSAVSSGPLTSYLNGFSAYAGGTYYTPMAYLETSADHARLRGRILTDGTPAAGQVIATLPADVWPQRTVQISVPANDGTHVLLDLAPTGEITCQTAGTYTSISLDGVTYFNAAN